MTLFISYRRKDSDRVDALVAALRDEGVPVWLDRAEIDDAASIQRRIDAGLAEAHALLAWYSADYPKSRACQWELAAALIAAGAETGPVKRLLLVNPEAAAFHIQPVQARDLQHFAFTGQQANECADLARRIKAAVAPIVGRVADLWAVHSALAAGNHAIVSGLPAQLAAAPIPRDLLAACLAEADGLAQLDAEDRADLGLQQCLDHSLAEEADGPQRFGVHSLVARTLRFHDPAPVRQTALRRAALLVLPRAMSAAADIREHVRLQPLLPHAQALARDAGDRDSLSLAGWLGRFELEGGRYRAAQAWCEPQYQGRWTLLGEDHPETLTSMNNLALTLWRIGERLPALQLMQAATEGRVRVLGPEHPDTLDSRQAAEQMRAKLRQAGRLGPEDAA